MGEITITEIGIAGAALVVANQALQIVAQLVKDKIDDKRGRQTKHFHFDFSRDPTIRGIQTSVERNNAILENMEDGVNAGLFQCRWTRDEVIRHVNRLNGKVD